MGRKFKTKKHKKLKNVDPNYTGIVIKDTGVNRQPIDIKAQEVPRKMEEMFKMCAILKNKKRLRPKKKPKRNTEGIIIKRDTLEETQPGMKKKLPDIPKVMKQGEYESDFRFINRIQDVATKAIAETKMEEKFGIDDIKDEDLLAEANGEEVQTKSKKKLKLKLYKQRKKDKKKAKIEDRIDEFSHFQDCVKFGEVAMEPPTLKTVKKIIKQKPKNMPGERSLILKRNLPTEVSQSLNLTGRNRSINLTKKRKDLSLSQREKLENERIQVVQLYKQLKAKRNKAKVAKT